MKFNRDEDLYWNPPNSSKAFLITFRVLIVAVLTLAAFGIPIAAIEIIKMYAAIFSGQ